MLFALSLCYSKPITRSATGYNHIFPSACFPSCPWVQYQASPRFTPPCPGSRTPHPCPRPSAPVPAPHGGWWQGQAAMACPSPARSRAAGGTRAAPASGTSLGTGAGQAQAGIGGLQFFLALKTATYSRGCVVIQSWLWGQGTCGMPAMAAPTGHGPLVCCASFSMPGKHRQPQITLFLKKPLNRAGMTQPFLVSLHRRRLRGKNCCNLAFVNTIFQFRKQPHVRIAAHKNEQTTAVPHTGASPPSGCTLPLTQCFNNPSSTFVLKFVLAGAWGLGSRLPLQVSTSDEIPERWK